MFGMSWFTVVTISLLLNKSTVFSLRCSYCSSGISWEDCSSKEKHHSCQVQNACIKFHRKITQPNGKEVQEFVKACFPSSLCTRDNCYESDDGKVTWCDFSCCSTDLCNQDKSKSKPCDNPTNLTQGSTRPKDKTNSGRDSQPVNRARDSNTNQKRKDKKSKKRKAVQTIVPRAAHTRKNSNKNIRSLVYVTVAMVSTSLVIARH
ncbi:uncharacterized protein LOC116305022 [Actinia tenebrosa]|uniref:Uncharacterized protein LOC116305022 n=1 Tax=Actinia tenebrosa TaxID=6105 RepID=A0A6P8IUH3_ACTTE|nr:uncharacterized protein LOC116305022 [Actinia tenebrosa]